MKKSSVALVMAAAIAASGCASQPAPRVSDAQGVESISAITMGCGTFGLTRDCSMWSGPTKKIEVSGQAMKVAGNEEGTITVLFGDNITSEAESSNLAYDLLKRELVSRGYAIEKVTPIESAGRMFGYAIETSEPNYHIWNEFAVE